MIGENASEVWFEDAGSDVLQRAVYERNRKTQNLLGIEIKPVYTGSVNDDVTAGIDEYDVALIPLGDSMVVAQNGNTLNFNNISTMLLQISNISLSVLSPYGLFFESLK